MSDRRGFVLAAALLALLLIAALVAGVFFASNEAARIGVAAADRQLALAAAESAAETRIAGWTPELSNAETGTTTSSSMTENGVPVAVYVTRLDSTLYWVVAVAGPARSASGVTARVGLVARVKNAPDGSTTVDRISERWWSELF